jgi:hypothetical protein
VIEVPPTLTPLNPTTFPDRIRAAFRELGLNLGDNQAKALASLVYLETGGGKQVICYNVGNLAAPEGYAGPAWRPPWYDPPTDATERLRRLHAEMLAGRAPSAFRAYSSEASGWRAFAALLSTARYANVLAAARTADPDQFRRALSTHYSPDYARPEVTASFRRIFDHYGVQRNGVALALILAAIYLA